MTRRGTLVVVGLVLPSVLALAIGLALAGTGGLLVTAGTLWVVLLFALRARLPREHVPTPVLLRAPPRRPNLAYPSFRRIESALSAASVSRREYDTGARPMLRRIALARLDSSSTRDSADGNALGARVPVELWQWLQPVWPPSPNSSGGGIDPGTLTAIVTTLEDM